MSDTAVAQDARVAGSRRAVALSALAGLVFTAATVLGLLARGESWSSVPFLLGAAASVGVLRLAEQHLLDYHHRTVPEGQERPKDKRDPLATRRGYLGFHAERAGWSPTAVVAGVWASWAVPAALFVLLVVNAVVTLATR